MTVKNGFKKKLLNFFIPITFMGFNNIKPINQSTTFDTKIQNSEMIFKKAEQITPSFQFKNPPIQLNKSTLLPSNTPPPQTIMQIPKYGSWFERSTGKIIRIRTTLERNANQNFPIVCDLVFIKDAETYARLTTTNTKDWFRIDEFNTEALKQKTKLMEVNEITLIPERERDTYLVKVPAHALAGIFFARLIGSDNLYPTLFDPYQDLDLDFRFNRFDLVQNE